MKTSRFLVPAIASALMLAACTGGADGTEEAAPSTTSQPNQAAPTNDDAEETSAPATDTEQGTEPEPLSVTIGAAGDLLAHISVVEDAAANAGGNGYDFYPELAPVADLITAPDLSICHMETPLSEDNTNLAVPGTLVFNTPHQLADAAAEAGFDGCDFASNHTMDRGIEGLRQTQTVIEEAGMTYAGPTAHEKQAGKPAWLEADGVKVAHLAYTYTLPNSGGPTTHVPGEAPWLKQSLWPAIGADGILEQAHTARDDGADFVVLSMHWGAEYQTEPTQQQRDLAEQLLSSQDVDLIIGTHVHVIQPCEQIDGKHVLYGLGNFLSNQSPDTTNGLLRPETQEGMLAQVTLTREDDGEVTSELRYQPTRVDLDGHVVRPATMDSAPQTYERTVATMNQLDCNAQPMD